jgi:hypothetical protein
MIGKKQISGYLERHYPEILMEFQAIVAASSLDDAGPIPVVAQ